MHLNCKTLARQRPKHLVNIDEFLSNNPVDHGDALILAHRRKDFRRERWIATNQFLKTAITRCAQQSEEIVDVCTPECNTYRKRRRGACSAEVWRHWCIVDKV